MEAIKLYFDKVTNKPQGQHAQTQNGEKVLYNIKQISEYYFVQYADMLAKENKATMFLPTGRFISVITCSLDVNQKFMATFDLFDSEPFAKEQAKQSEGNYDIFMKAFYEIRKNYQQDYNRFILVEGEIPPQPIQAP